MAESEDAKKGGRLHSMNASGGITHVISGLGTGGAEVMLRKLLSSIDIRQRGATVVSLRDRGTMADSIEAEGVNVETIGIQGSFPSPASVWRFRRMMRRLQPRLLQGWMYHGNIAALAGSQFSNGRPPVVWNVRHSALDLGEEKRSTVRLIRLGARLSKRALRIVYNSRESAKQHERMGYASDRSVVIPNGFDLDRFSPSGFYASRLRNRTGVECDTVLIGVIGRFHPIKGHLDFFRAANLIKRRHSNTHFVFAGKGMDSTNVMVRDQLREFDLAGRVTLLSEVKHVERIMPGLDILCSPSVSEAFPNVVGEAMACGIPCVVTDVGDCTHIVGDTGISVSPRDPAAMAAACAQLIEEGEDKRRQLGYSARKRVANHFSLPMVVARYVELYDQILDVR